jgi:hypothetical protein
MEDKVMNVFKELRRPGEHLVTRRDDSGNLVLLFTLDDKYIKYIVSLLDMVYSRVPDTIVHNVVRCCLNQLRGEEE